MAEEDKKYGVAEPNQGKNGKMVSNMTGEDLDSVFDYGDIKERDKTVIKEVLSFLDTRPGGPAEMLAEELKRKWQIVEIPKKDYNKSVWGQLTKDERLGMSVQGFRTDTDENGNPIRIPHIGFSADLDYLDEFCSRLANKVKNL